MVVVGGSLTVVLFCSDSETDSSWKTGWDGGGWMDDKRWVTDVIVVEATVAVVVVGVVDKTVVVVTGSELLSMETWDVAAWDVESGADTGHCVVVVVDDDVVSVVGKTEDDETTA